MSNVKDLNLRTLSALYINSQSINTNSLTINGIPIDPTSDIVLTSSGIIPTTNTSTYFSTYKSYSLNSSGLPKFTLDLGITNQNIDLNLLNPKSGNVSIETNLGSFNLTFDNQNVDLQYINGRWVQKGIKSPWFVNRQQGTKLVSSDRVGSSQQGRSCSLSADGNTLAIGGSGDGSSVGAVWIFTKSGNTWTQQGNKLVGSGYTGASLQGASCSLSADGNTLAIGGHGNNEGGASVGATWIFTRSGNPATWTQQGNRIIGTGYSGSSRQGYSCSLSADGNTLAVGGYGDNGNNGAMWVFTRNSSVWTQQGTKLIGTGNSGTSRQGFSCSLSSDGNTLAVGGYLDNSNTGATWIFTQNSSVWTQQGSKLVGTGASGSMTSQQGISCSLSANGNTLAVGGSRDKDNIGATWIFTRLGTSWMQQNNKLVGTGNIGISAQGLSCSLSADGNTLAVGGASDGGNVGATWIFTRSGNSPIWTQQGSKLVGSGSVSTSSQGISCSLSADGNELAVGGSGDSLSVGATWVFI